MPECGHLSIEANETTYFNSQDLERGNLSKGLSDGVGDGEDTGVWSWTRRSISNPSLTSEHRTAL